MRRDAGRNVQPQPFGGNLKHEKGSNNTTYLGTVSSIKPYRSVKPRLFFKTNIFTWCLLLWAPSGICIEAVISPDITATNFFGTDSWKIDAALSFGKILWNSLNFKEKWRQIQPVPRKAFWSADCDTIYTIYLFLCTQSADPNAFRGTACTWNSLSLSGCLK